MTKLAEVTSLDDLRSQAAKALLPSAKTDSQRLPAMRLASDLLGASNRPALLSRFIASIEGRDEVFDAAKQEIIQAIQSLLNRMNPHDHKVALEAILETVEHGTTLLQKEKPSIDHRILSSEMRALMSFIRRRFAPVVTADPPLPDSTGYSE